MALTDNLVSYWKFDGNSNDSVSTNNGSDTNITYNASYGKIGQGASFNGSNSYILLGESGMPTGSTAKTIAGWVYVSTQPSDTNGLVFFQMGKREAAKLFSIEYYNNGGTYEIWAQDYTSTPKWTYTLTTGQWFHVAMTNTGTTTELFINGSSQTSKTQTAQNINLVNGDINIGRRSGDGWFWNGYIDEVGIWSRALTTAEITTLYNGGSGLTYPFTSTSARVHNLGTLGVGA